MIQITIFYFEIFKALFKSHLQHDSNHEVKIHELNRFSSLFLIVHFISFQIFFKPFHFSLETYLQKSYLFYTSCLIHHQTSHNHSSSSHFINPFLKPPTTWVPVFLKKIWIYVIYNYDFIAITKHFYEYMQVLRR